MTLIEFIVVVVVLAILALMLFPMNPHSGRRRKAKLAIARMEIGALVTAIKQYEIAYRAFPVSTNIPTLSVMDFTYGTFGTSARTTVTNSSGYQANNSEVVAILLARTNGRSTSNFENLRNPEKFVFLNARIVADTKSPGVGPDGVYRDPWGNPYIISLDLNGDWR